MIQRKNSQHIIRYNKILNRVTKNSNVRIHFQYSLDDFNNFNNIKCKNLSYDDKLKLMSQLADGIKYDVIDIFNGVKFYFRFKDISNVFVTIYKTGEIIFLFDEKNLVDNNKIALFFIDDFIEKFGNINNFCEFLFQKHLIENSILDNLFIKIIHRFPNYSSNYGTPYIKLTKQNDFKKNILINFIFNIKKSNFDLVNSIDSNNRDWCENLNSSDEIIDFINNEFTINKLDKKDVIINHLNKCLDYSQAVLNSQNKRVINIYNGINNIYQILDKSIITKETYRDFLNQYDKFNN